MTADWRDVVRAETAEVPAGAKARVWDAMHQVKPLPRRPWVWAPLAAVVSAAVVLVWFATPRPTTASYKLTEGTVLLHEAVGEWVEPSLSLRLEHGVAVVSTWSNRPIHITAGTHRIDVEAATLVVKMAGESVVVAPMRGYVMVDGERVDATAATRALASESFAAVREPSDVESRQASVWAERALEAHRWQEAAQALEVVGHSNSLPAEAALVRKGELELRELKNPERALATFEGLALRFAEGSLVQERELSSLEAELELKRWSAAERRANAFLERYPASERLRDVQRVLATALLRQGDLERACSRIAQLPGATSEFAEACGGIKAK